MSVESKLSRLSLDLKAQSPGSSGTLANNKTDGTPDSWEDQPDDEAPVEAPGPSLKQITSNDNPAPPPPTPVSQENSDPFARKWEPSAAVDSGRPTLRYGSPANGDRRPEKTTSTANRLIAGALGIKAPKKTEEQKQYDKAVKDAEIRRKNREREQQQRERLEDEKAKAAVWDA
ncbi:hypothetical protein H2198_005137 [Neophaeococcomyces mojaviensis]|uniref:Uncharacterized protein n=1 Tax=Neophaeococcomyces mojaviensis TaxID=3383035 RepID=A0ACC3A6W4_9EURO|nr:hypothetical protein H2198_005137 [Knufia sp. JES_112]